MNVVYSQKKGMESITDVHISMYESWYANNIPDMQITIDERINNLSMIAAQI